MSRIIISPDSFKGTITGEDAAAALRAGWASVAPDDEVILLPQADGGEGTCEVIANAVPDAQWRQTDHAVTGPDGRPVPGRWVVLPGGEAVVELAIPSGLPLMKAKDPRGAQTRGLGQVLRAAVEAGATKLSVGLGGSASTDGGVGALRELGARFLTEDGDEISDGGRGLTELASIDSSELIEAPTGGVRLLCDVTSPLTGPTGSAAIFGPQKGATPDDVAYLDDALGHLAQVAGGDPDYPGTGAAGGTAYGLMTLWGASIVSGAQEVAKLTGLADELSRADLAITGEGSFDVSSLAGKAVATIIDAAATTHTPCAVVAGAFTTEGSQALDRRGIARISLTELAGSASRAMAEPAYFLEMAAAQLARDFHRPEQA